MTAVESMVAVEDDVVLGAAVRRVRLAIGDGRVQRASRGGPGGVVTEVTRSPGNGG